jgi:anti-anti-sigma factor
LATHHLQTATKRAPLASQGNARTPASHGAVTAARDDLVMLIRTWALDAITIVDLHGRLDVETGAALHEVVCEILGAGRRSLVINLLGVTGVDAAGLGTLADAFSVSRATGGDLKLVVRCAEIRELLARTKLLELLPALPTEAEAIASFEPLAIH